MVEIANIVSALQARKGSWRQIAVASGVPYSTLSKIARGKIDNPGIGTVNKLLPHLDDEVPEPSERAA